jgi:hypothetical protein
MNLRAFVVASGYNPLIFVIKFKVTYPKQSTLSVACLFLFIPFIQSARLLGRLIGWL